MVSYKMSRVQNLSLSAAQNTPHRPAAVDESLAHLYCERFEVDHNLMGLAIGSL